MWWGFILRAGTRYGFAKFLYAFGQQAQLSLKLQYLAILFCNNHVQAIVQGIQESSLAFQLLDTPDEGFY
jgi:hypothetical protein